MAWIESHQTLDKNGKLLELANLLGVNKYQAIGHLHALWWWAIDNAEDGNLKRFSNATVTQACGWDEYIKDEDNLARINEITNRGKGAIFIDSLIKCGFLDRRDQGLFIHNWGVYTNRYFKSVTKSAKEREQGRERVRRHRRSNAAVTLVKRSVTPSTVPNHTVPNLTKEEETPIGVPSAPRALSDVQKIVKGWKLLTGIPVEGDQSKAWDKVHFARHAKSADQLLSLFGNWQTAVECMEYVYDELTRKKLTCTIETVVKRSDSFREHLAGAGR